MEVFQISEEAVVLVSQLLAEKLRSFLLLKQELNLEEWQADLLLQRMRSNNHHLSQIRLEVKITGYFLTKKLQIKAVFKENKEQRAQALIHLSENQLVLSKPLM